MDRPRSKSAKPVMVIGEQACSNASKRVVTKFAKLRATYPLERRG
jgi:hypothetical protein